MERVHLTTLDVPTGPVELCRAGWGDVERILHLLADDDVARGRGATAAVGPAHRAAFDAIDADPAQLLVVGRDGAGQMVATMQLTFIPGLSRQGATRMQIEAVRVDRSHRSGGLGSAMIRWALDEARRRGAALAQLTSDQQRADARRFYERLGFVASHTGFKIKLD